MATQTIFLSFLLLHLTGVILFAGTTVVDFIALRQFGRQYGEDRIKAGGALQLMMRFPLLIRIGIIVIILTGVGMMGVTHGVFGEQVWFRIKFGLVLIIILNYLLVGRRQALALRKAVDSNADNGLEVMKWKDKLNWFLLAQLCMFFIIILLSVFKFN